MTVRVAYVNINSGNSCRIRNTTHQLNTDTEAGLGYDTLNLLR